MSIVCCRSHCPQQSWQISRTMRSPVAPPTPIGGFSNPARVWPHLEQVTSGIFDGYGCGVPPKANRLPDAGAWGAESVPGRRNGSGRGLRRRVLAPVAVVAGHAVGVLDLRQAEQRQEADVEPPDVELIPLVPELRGVRVGVVVVVEL